MGGEAACVVGGGRCANGSMGTCVDESTIILHGSDNTARILY